MDYPYNPGRMARETGASRPVARMKETEKSPLRIEFIDGLRGLAALYVVIVHAFSVFDRTKLDDISYLNNRQVDTLIGKGAEVFTGYATYAVVIFIVLSGYSLMLPVVRKGDGRLTNGFGDYLKKRVRRIMPPYYAALAFALLMAIIIPALNSDRIVWWWNARPIFDSDSILAHLLMIHNWRSDWAYQINLPMWSIPIEFQIYFLFPLILLPVWRRFGSIASFLVAFAMGISLVIAFGYSVKHTAPWFLGLFALGMLGASVGFSKKERVWLERINWLWLSGLFGGLFLLFYTGRNFSKIESPLVEPLDHTLMGFFTVSLLIHYSRIVQSDQKITKISLLNGLISRPVVNLGHFSYSLYLIHSPILVASGLLAQDLRLTGLAALFFIVGVGIAVSLVAAYFFYRMFEKPFMSLPSEKTKPATVVQRARISKPVIN
jgi:peptidoglycan/LPS O-acetylase OafA/YrhL